MGRRGNAERLANPVFKMAVISMADFPKFQRPVNEACSKKKIVCPEASCQKENLFFEENGLGHHFRTIHRKEVNAKVVSKAVVKTRELYGQETLDTLLLSRNGNRRLVYALFMFFILSGTVMLCKLRRLVSHVSDLLIKFLIQIFHIADLPR